MFVVIINKLRNKIIEMRLAESDEMVQSFVFYSLDKPLDPCIKIRRPDGQHLRLDTFVLQQPLELGRELCVPIMNQEGWLLILIGNVVYERFGLFRDPGRIGISR